MKPRWPGIDSATVGKPAARALVDIETMLRGGLTLGDNFHCAVIKRDLIHGAETPITLGFKPIGVYALRSESIGAGARYAVDSLDWRPDVPGGTIGVTVSYAPPLGYCRASSSVNVSIPHNALTSVTLNAAEQSGNTSWVVGSPTLITCAVAGRVSVGMSGLYDTAAGGHRDGYILKNNAPPPYYAYDVTPGGSYAAVNGSDEVDVVAGDYFVFKANQNQTAVAALNLIASTISFRVRYVAPPSTAQNTVTLLCVGG